MSNFSYSHNSYLWIHRRLEQLYRWLGRLLEDNEKHSKNPIAVLDGVRAIAILFVLTFHINRINGDDLWNRMANPIATSVSTAGGTGVTLFFVLSGFLLFMPYAKALLFKTSWPLARVFYMRRVLRIIPAYYVSLFLLIVFSQSEYLRPDHSKDLVLFLTFFMDSSIHTFRQLNGPFWTLAIEWQFYMLLPLIALTIGFLVKRVSTSRRLPAVMICLSGLIGLGLFVRYWGFYLLAHPSVTFLVPRSVLNIVLFFTFGRTGKFTEDFAVGMFISLCYIYLQHPSTDKKFMRRVERFWSWLWIGGMLVLVFSAMWHFNHEMHGWPFLNGLLRFYDDFSDILLAIGYGACIAAILFGPRVLKRPFEWPLLRWIGLISYSLYMWHLPLLIFLQSEILPHLHGLNRYTTYGIFWLWALLVVLPFALLSYLVVEKPWMKLGDDWRRTIEKRAREHAARPAALSDQGVVPKSEVAKVPEAIKW